jgi:hypothetical protein
MSQRVKHAFRTAVTPTLAMVVVSAFIVVTRWSKFADDPVAGIATMSGLLLIVFLTYFVLGVIGFKASPQGVVNAPRIYAWPVLCAIVILVFGVLFYLSLLRG